MSAPLRVLIVDDNLSAGTSLAVLLECLGHVPKLMSAGHAALEVLQVFRPDIAMIDIDMPEMDGHEVAQRIRELPAFTSLPLVAFTACEPVEVFGHRPHSHFDFHLPKPFRLNELKSLVRIALDRQALRNNRSGDGMALA